MHSILIIFNKSVQEKSSYSDYDLNSDKYQTLFTWFYSKDSFVRNPRFCISFGLRYIDWNWNKSYNNLFVGFPGMQLLPVVLTAELVFWRALQFLPSLVTWRMFKIQTWKTLQEKVRTSFFMSSVSYSCSRYLKTHLFFYTILCEILLLICVFFFYFLPT